MAEVERTRRRNKEDVRRLILAAARQCFEAKGYRATSREIAAVAGVNEVLIFRHFGSKAGLFEAIVSDLLETFQSSFVAIRNDSEIDPKLAAERTRAFVGELYDVLKANRRLLFAMLSAMEFEEEVDGDREMHAMDAYFVQSEREIAKRWKALRVKTAITPGQAARFAFTLVAGTVLFQNWSNAPKTGRKATVDALTQFMLTGIDGSR